MAELGGPAVALAVAALVGVGAVLAVAAVAAGLNLVRERVLGRITLRTRLAER